MQASEKPIYARPEGRYWHTSKDCPMLKEGQFERLGYIKISPSDSLKRRLHFCACTQGLSQKSNTS